MHFITALHPVIRILLIFLIAFIAHFIVRELKQLTEWVLVPNAKRGILSREVFTWRHPKLASLITVFVSAITFSIYFIAIGLIFKEFLVLMRIQLLVKWK